jgi:pimeloyl-ACP methyl ester carboxylesterase
LLPQGFKPIFVGIVWPSTALTFSWEDAPDFAGDGAGDGLASNIDEAKAIRDLLPPAEIQNFDTLVATRRNLTVEEARLLARIIAPVLADSDDASEQTAGFSPEDLLSAWRAAPPIKRSGTGVGSFDDFGTAGDTEAGPQAAGMFDFLDPRHIIRLSTVLLMKDRAGVVGSNGVGDLVRRLQRETRARIRLIGHSYGAKVVLSALAQSSPAPLVQSVLLLQPAISHLCFAAKLEDGHPGGYRKALPLVQQPIFSTFSSNDFPLYRVFHYAARRRSDIGEAQIAGTPSRYAALGGYGPSGCSSRECVVAAIAAAGSPYPARDANVRLLALDGTTGINGHGDVETPYIAWAFLNQLK